METYLVSLLPPSAPKSPRVSVYRLCMRERNHGRLIVCFFFAVQLLISDALRMSSPNLTTVTNAMTHALSARFPWRRYLPGLDAKFFYKPMSLLPAFIADNVYSSMFTKIIENKKKLAMKEREKHKTIWILTILTLHNFYLCINRYNYKISCFMM